MKKIDIKGIALKVGATGAGAAAAAALNNVSAFDKIPEKIKPIVKIALGAFLPKFLGSGKKAAIVEQAANGIIAVGALELANSFISNPAKSLKLAGHVATTPPANQGVGAITYRDETYGNSVLNGVDDDVMLM